MERKPSAMRTKLMLPLIAAMGAGSRYDASDASVPSLADLRERQRDRGSRNYASGGATIPFAGLTYTGHTPRGDRDPVARRAQKQARKLRRKRKLIRGYFIG